MNDKLLRQQVVDQLDFDPSIDSAAIGVSVSSGVVTLSGHVPSYLQKIQAEKIAKGVKGVRGIAQEVEVRFAGEEPLADDEIAKRCLAAIGFDSVLDRTNLQVKVALGWVTLSGEAEWQFQRTAAEADVRKIRGVTGITNLVTLRPRPITADVQARISDALKRDASLDAQSIRVKVLGDEVTLEGSVDCYRDRALVEHAAWSAPGVRSVKDNLHIA